MNARDQYNRCLTGEISLETAKTSLHVACAMAIQGEGPEVDHELLARLQTLAEAIDKDIGYLRDCRVLHGKHLGQSA